jgi:hypothetical protein
MQWDAPKYDLWKNQGFLRQKFKMELKNFQSTFKFRGWNLLVRYLKDTDNVFKPFFLRNDVHGGCWPQAAKGHFGWGADIDRKQKGKYLKKLEQIEEKFGKKFKENEKKIREKRRSKSKRGRGDLETGMEDGVRKGIDKSKT